MSDSTMKRINAVVLFVEDLGRAKAFYGDALGLTLDFEDAASAAFKFEDTLLILLSIAGAQDLLSNEAVAVNRPAGATSLLVSFVQDVDAIHRDLVSKGVEFIRDPIDRAWGLRTAHFKDSEGNVWELAQPLTAPDAG